MLTEVHRQAADNPIIAHVDARSAPGAGWRSAIMARAASSAARELEAPPCVTRADQLLVGTNKSRRAFNRPDA